MSTIINQIQIMQLYMFIPTKEFFFHWFEK